MTPDRLRSLTERYSRLRVAVVGDFFLDRYLEIDPTRNETSIETGWTAYNVVRIRHQAGAAGTILNNLAALGVGTIFPIGFCGDDGDGFELRRALGSLPGVHLDPFLTTDQRSTPVYGKPLVIEPGRPPRELNRLDTKNWTATPAEIQRKLADFVIEIAPRLDAMIVMDQVDLAETGAATAEVCRAVRSALDQNPRLLVLADSRRGVEHLPPLGFKMNAAELARLGSGEAARQAEALARTTGQPVFVTLAEGGILGAKPGQIAEHVPSLPVRGPIDVVGAGDAVTANLTAALASGATLREAMEIAMTAASLVVHQLGTTGTASLAEIEELLSLRDAPSPH